MEYVIEGSAKIRVSTGKISKELEVFYNPVMKFNRDVSVQLLNAVNNKDMQICDLFAASGVRTIRFAKELKKGKIKNIVANDMSEKAIELMKENLKANNIDATIMNKEARMLLMDCSGFDYIDIDPFGYPGDFLDAAVQRISRDGILAVTATDTSSLSGSFEDACRRKYWAKPMRNYLMHEIGLRIFIRRVQLIGAMYDKALIPIYSYSKDHYMRIFFKCDKGKQKVDLLLRQHRYFLHCRCLNRKTSEYNIEKCDCGKDFAYAGPIYIGSLYDKRIAKKIKGDKFMDVLSNELDIVGFYDVAEISSLLKINIPTIEKIEKAIVQEGNTFSRTHFSPTGFKSDAGIDEIIKMIKKIS